MVGPSANPRLFITRTIEYASRRWLPGTRSATMESAPIWNMGVNVPRMIISTANAQ